MSSRNQLVFVSNPEFPMKTNYRRNLSKPCQPLDYSEQSPQIRSKEMIQSPLSNMHLLNINHDIIDSQPISSHLHRHSQSFDINDSLIFTEQRQNKAYQQHLYKYLHLFDVVNNQIFQRIDQRHILTEYISMLWNLIIICNFIGICIYLPMKITLFLLIFVLIKTIDILILLNQEYFEDGQIINDKHQIYNRYFSLYFYLDVIHLITIFLLFIHSLNENKLIKWMLILIVIVSNIRRVSQSIYQLRFRFNLLSSSLELIFNLCKIAIILHIIASLWLDTIYQFELDYEQERYNNSNGSYLNSLVIVTSILTFNSSYQPQKLTGQMIYIAISILSLYILAFILHSTKQLFSNNKEIQELSQILNENRLSSTLKYKILSSVENKQIKRNSQVQYNSFFKQLPDDLQSEIVISQRYKILQSYFNLYEEQSLINMVNACEEMTCNPNTIIISQGISDDQSIYFIIDGQLDVFIYGQRTFLHRLRKGQVFGEISFISQCPRSATVKSHKSCQLLKLTQELFLKTLTQRDRQIYFSQRDSLLFARKYPFSCFCCGENTHKILECPILTFQPNLKSILDQEIKLSQPRRKFKREKQKQHYGPLKMVRFFKENQQGLLELYEEQAVSAKDLTIYPTLPYETTNPQFLSNRKIQMEKLKSNPNSVSDVELEIQQEDSSNSEREFITNIKREIGQQKKYIKGRIRIEDQILQELPSLEEECSILDGIQNKEAELKPTIMYQSDVAQSDSDLRMGNKDSLNSNRLFKSSDSLRFPRGLSNFGKYFSSKNQIQSLSKIRSKSSHKCSSNFQPFQDQQEYNEDFEKMHFFEYFHPNFNYDTIITKMNIHFVLEN